MLAGVELVPATYPRDLGPLRPRAAKAAVGIAWCEKGGKLHRKNLKIIVEYPMQACLEKKAFEELS